MATQKIAGRWVLLDIKSGQYYALDGVAGRIWQLCDGSRDIRQIAAGLLDEYDTQGEPVKTMWLPSCRSSSMNRCSSDGFLTADVMVFAALVALPMRLPTIASLG